MILPNRGLASRARRLGVALSAAALVAAALPATASAQDGAGSLVPEETGNSSVDQAIGLLPEEIVIGGGGLGSEALRDMGSGVVPDTALSVGQSVGSVAPLEALGSAGGSAAASVASSGIVPGSTYVNPAGSIGSGTIGIGSVAIPEYVIPAVGVQLAAGYFAVTAERQQAGQLSPEELDFWHGVVEGSAAGGAAVQDVADATGTELPGPLVGSIDSVQIAAQQDPHEQNARLRAEAEAAAEAGDAGAAEAGAGD